MNWLRQDLRYGLRSLVRTPGFTTVAVLILALGIGANALIFSLVNSVLLRPLAYPEPQQLFVVREIVPLLSHVSSTLPANPLHFLEWREQCSSFEDMAAVRPAAVNLTGEGESEQIGAAVVSPNIFSMLGVEAQLGRTFLEEEETPGRDAVVVATDSLWRRRFQRDPGVVGRAVTLDGREHLVVGILPPSFRFPRSEQLGELILSVPDVEVFRPLALKRDAVSWTGAFDYVVLARLSEGLSPEQALQELDAVQARIAERWAGGAELRATLLPLHEQVVGPARRGLTLLLAAVGILLLIACVNLANLAMARAIDRSREAAIRNALGASRGRLVRQVIVESLALAFFGGLVALLTAAQGVNLLAKTGAVVLPRLEEVELDGRVVAFTLLLTAVTGVLSGVLPAMRGLRSGLGRIPQGGWPSDRRRQGGCTAPSGSGEL